MLWQVSTNRVIGRQDYEVEGLLEALTASQAAKTFASDMASVGWSLDTVVVSRPGLPNTIRVFTVRKNLIQEDCL